MTLEAIRAGCCYSLLLAPMSSDTLKRDRTKIIGRYAAVASKWGAVPEMGRQRSCGVE